MTTVSAPTHNAKESLSDGQLNMMRELHYESKLRSMPFRQHTQIPMPDQKTFGFAIDDEICDGIRQSEFKLRMVNETIREIFARNHKTLQSDRFAIYLNASNNLVIKATNNEHLSTAEAILKIIDLPLAVHTYMLMHDISTDCYPLDV